MVMDRKGVEKGLGRLRKARNFYSESNFSSAEPPIIIPLTLGSDILNEGQFVQILCTVTEGDEPLSIKWSLQGDTVSSEPQLTTAALGSRTSMLTIQSVGYRHSGTYTCSASNKAGTRSRSVELRVNGEGRYVVCEQDKRFRLVTNFHETYFLLYTRTFVFRTALDCSIQFWTCYSGRRRFCSGYLFYK